jgi:branched-chain amino acid transport system substrate-binding protein
VVISQVVPFPYGESAAVVREYQQRMKEAGQTELDFSSLEGFLTAKVFTEGLKRAGRNLTRESLTTGLESMHDVNLGGFLINYGPTNHQGSNFTDLTMVGRGGKFVH